MISLETARKLKDAGLKHEWQIYDFFSAKTKEEDAARPYYSPTDNDIFIPRIDQLLAEIGKRGYCWKLYKNTHKFPTGEYDMAVYGNGKVIYHTPYCTDTPEESTAQALLWILEQKEE